MSDSELDRVMKRNVLLVIENDHLKGQLDRMRELVRSLHRERDEARRIVCSLEADTTEDQREYAKQRGWDCFGPNMCKEAQHDLEADTHTG